MRLGRRIPLLLYVGAIISLTLMFTGSLLAKAHNDGMHGWPLAILGFLALLGTSHLAVALVNWLTTLLVAPHSLPRMDFSREYRLNTAPWLPFRRCLLARKIFRI